MALGPWDGLIDLGAAVALAAGTWMAARATGRGARDAAQGAAAASGLATAAQRDAEFIRTTMNRLGVLEAEANTLRAAQSRDASELGELRERVRRLEQEQVQDRAKLQTLRRYCRHLLRLMRQSKLAYPDPPDALDG